MKGSKWSKKILAMLLICGLPIGGVLVETSFRVAQTVSIPVDTSLAPDITISASRMPDFLWAGTAWMDQIRVTGSI